MSTALGGALVSMIAAAIVLSPLTVAALALLALIMRAVCGGVSGAERRALLWMLIAAIALRVAAVAVLFLCSDPYQLSSFPFDADGRFLKLRSLLILNVWQGVPVDRSHLQAIFENYGWTSYIYLLAYVQYLLGPAPYAVHLLSVCWAIAAAGLLYRLVCRSFGPRPALVGLGFTLFLPTLFMWSVSAMKESWLLFLTTVVLVGVERTIRGGHWMVRLGWASAVVAAALALDTTRMGSLWIVCGSLFVAGAGVLVTRSRHVLVVSIVVLPLLVTVALQQSWVQDRVMSRVRTAAAFHIGHVHTDGYAYKLLDQRLYSGDSLESLTWDEARRFMLRAVSSFVLLPLPSRAESRSQLLFIPQQLIWYALALLAAAGALHASRRDALVAWLFIGLIGVTAVVIAPHEGNMGTLVRHRDGILPFVVQLSAIALTLALSRAGSVPFLIEGSIVVSRLRRGCAVIRGRAVALRAVWRQSALAAMVDEIRGMEDWLWVRRFGIALLAGAALTVAITPIASLTWVSVLVWTVTTVCALIQIVYAPALVRAWREKRASLTG